MDAYEVAIIEEARRRFGDKSKLAPAVGHNPGAGDFLLTHLFDRQKAFVLDVAPKVVALCGRRAGKTTAMAANLLMTALERPGGTCVYITLTLQQAKRILWDELKRLRVHYDIDATFNEVELTVKLKNGSTIWIKGADKLPEVDKWRGIAYVLVVVDECASFPPHLEALVRDVFEPAIEDYRGRICLIGTPSGPPAGLFYDVSMTDLSWSKHHWTVLDNPRFPRWATDVDWQASAKQWMAELMAKNGWDETSTTYRREWMGQWCVDSQGMVYLYDPAKNLFTGALPGDEWRYVLGLDLGFRDDTAFVVLAFSKYQDTCYFVHAEKHAGLAVSEIAEKVRGLRGKYQFCRYIADTGGLGAQIVAELQRRYSLPFVAAEKREKMANIRMMNSDFLAGKIKAYDGPLTDEWLALPLDENEEEDERYPNHCADAALYAYRYSLHFKGKALEVISEEDAMYRKTVEKRRQEVEKKKRGMLKGWTYGIRA